MAISKLPPAPEEVWLDCDNNLVINGEPHFPTGFYSVDWMGRMDVPTEGQYTLFHTYATSSAARLDPEQTDWKWQEWLDAGAANGMRAFLGIGYGGDRTEDFHQRLVRGGAPEPERQMREFIRRWRDHPGVAAWYLYDEPSLSGRTKEEMQYLYELADTEDPYHPKAVCQVFWSDASFVPWLDILMPDPYPIRAENSRPLRSVASAVRAARHTVRDEKPVWAVLQWYQYPEGRYPTPREMRCMAFLAVAAGAKGVVWYSFYHGYNEDSKHWPELASIGRELRSIEDVVLASSGDVPVRIEPDDLPIELLAKRDGNTVHVVCVNCEDRDIDEVTLNIGSPIASASERLGNKDLTVRGSTVRMALAGYEPAVLTVELQ
jgi:hypothetical protein